MTSTLETHRHIHPAPTVWVLHFHWPTNPLPMNGPKANWRARAAMTRHVKHVTLTLALAARIPELAKIETQLTWWVDRMNRRRDVDNLGLFEKPIYDALVMAGIVRDDTPDLMVKPRPVIRPVADAHGLVTAPCFTLHVRALDHVEEIEL
jgi:hypothetical protein